MTPQVSNNAQPPTGPADRRKLYVALGAIVLAIVWLAVFSGKQVAATATRPKAESVQPTTPETSKALTAQLMDGSAKLRDAQDRLDKSQQDLDRQQKGLPPLPDRSAPNPNQPPPAQQIPEEIRKRNDTLHASNIVMSFRPDAMQQVPQSQKPVDPIEASLQSVRQQATQLKDEIAANIAQTEQFKPPAQPPAPTYSYERREVPQKTPEPPSELTEASGPTYRVFEGTILESVLTNRLNGSYAGPVDVMITAPVYSHDHQHLLIPEGSRVLGDVRQTTATGQQRLALSFRRMIMPDGFSVDLTQTPGLGMDEAGATGIKDKVDTHWKSVFGTSIALGLISGFSLYGTQGALTAGGIDQYRQGVASSVGQSSSRILDSRLNAVPTLEIREGHRVKIWIGSDLALPDYSRHHIKGDI